MAYTAPDKQKNYIITVDADLFDLPWNEVIPLALLFWQTLSEQTLLSRAFRDIAVHMLHYVQRDIALKINN